MIRKPELDDLEDLNSLSKRSWLEGFSDLLSDEELQLARGKDSFTTEKDLKNSINSDSVLIRVCEKDGEVVGKAKLAFSEEEMDNVADVERNEVQLRSFYVHPDYWRQGIGTSLLDSILKEAPVWAEVVKVEALEGSSAVKFYRENGFKKTNSGTFSAEDVDIIENDYPTVIMEKELE